MSAKRKAFVISPIGGVNRDGTPDERRTHADQVFFKIIAPAFEELRRRGYEIAANRSDHDRSVEQILASVLRGIRSDELVVCVLSDHDPMLYNANVFYELGIAHAAGRPTLLLKHFDQPTPFDLTNEKYITYRTEHLTGAADPMAPDGPATALVEQAEGLLKARDFYRKPFNEDLVLGRQGALDRFQAIKFPEWSDTILSAEKEIWLAGTTLWDFIDRSKQWFLMPDAESGELNRPAHLIDLLTYKLSQGVDVTVLYCAPDHPLIDHLLNRAFYNSPAEYRAAVERVRQTIRDSSAAWRAAQNVATAAIEKGLREGLAPDTPRGAFTIVEVRHGAIFNRVCMTEKRAFVTPNMYSITYNTGPCVDARGNSAWHKTVRDELIYLRTLNLNPGGQEAESAGPFARLFGRRR